jgi:hypothetical protein
MKVVTIPTGLLHPQEIFLTSVKGLSLPHGHSAPGRVMSMKKSSDTVENRNHNLLSCSAVPQPAAPQRAQSYVLYIYIYLYITTFVFCIHHSWLRSQSQDNYFRTFTLLANPDIYFCSSGSPKNDLYGQSTSPFLVRLCCCAVAKMTIYNHCFTWLFNFKNCFNGKITANNNKTCSDNWVRDVGRPSRIRIGYIFWCNGTSYWRHVQCQYIVLHTLNCPFILSMFSLVTSRCMRYFGILGIWENMQVLVRNSKIRSPHLTG